jgi:hypothetical protein
VTISSSALPSDLRTPRNKGGDRTQLKVSLVTENDMTAALGFLFVGKNSGSINQCKKPFTNTGDTFFVAACLIIGRANFLRACSLIWDSIRLE